MIIKQRAKVRTCVCVCAVHLILVAGAVRAVDLRYSVLGGVVDMSLFLFEIEISAS